MNWIEVTITTTRDGTDAISEVFYQAGIKGLIIQDPHDIDILKGQKADWDYIDDSLEDLWGEKIDKVLVKGYIADNSLAIDIISLIKSRMDWLLKQDLGIDIGEGEIIIANVQEENWANNWKKYFKAQKVGERMVIKPSWEDYRVQKDEIILELDPGMAFGTGTHETTILCMEALEHWIDSKTHLLDVGCGTGILAIAGLLLGAKKATAVDLDLDAVRVAKENAKRNEVIDKINIVHGDLLENVTGVFDIVVSNIIADVIIEISKELKKYLSHEGIFIASGIILDRVEDVKAALEENGLSVIDTKVKGEWVALVSRSI